MTFSEAISPGTATEATIKVLSPDGPVTGVLQVTDGDTVVTFTPLSLLRDQTRYTIVVSGIEDRIGTAMAGSFTSTFTTVDITPPSAVDLTPTVDANGVTSTRRFASSTSEPINPASYRGPPIRLETGGAVVDGRIDYLFGNTVVVFSPLRPLEESRSYVVRAEQAFDLSGLGETQPTIFTFTTTDRTPPVLTGLTATNNGTVITNSFVTVTANTGASHDVAVVDFFVNGTFAGTARLAPFTLNLQAVTALGAVGEQIHVEAFGVDTSGNRSVAAVETFVTILTDRPPAIAIASPAGGAAFRNGDRVDVSISANDDLGIARIGFRAGTGRPQDADSASYTPANLQQTQTFAFTIPLDAAPGAIITIDASAVDTKGEQSVAAPVAISVLDSVPPTITISGASTGDKAVPGQDVTVVVSAADAGGIAAINFTASGVASSKVARPIDPPRTPVSRRSRSTCPLPPGPARACSSMPAPPTVPAIPPLQPD